MALQPTEQTQHQPASQQRSPSHASYNPLRGDFWRGMSLLKISFARVVSKFLLVAVCVAPTLLAACAGESSARTGVSMQPSAATNATPTQSPPPLSGVTLGGTRDEFTRKLGAPTTERFGEHVYTFTLPDGTLVYVGGIYEHTGTDGTPHIAGFHVDGPGETRWSDQQCAAIVPEFLLPDAKLVSHSTTQFDQQVDTYTSATLARMFPASEFKNVLGDLVAPGTFQTVCPNGAPQDWTISAGAS